MVERKYALIRINSAAQSGSGSFNAWKHSPLSQTTVDGKFCMTAHKRPGLLPLSSQSRQYSGRDCFSLHVSL